MLIALTEKGIAVNLVFIKNPAELLKLKEKGKFYCPQCQNSLHLKIGTQKIPHFAHTRHSHCPGSTEAESPMHLKGKQDLFLWFRKKGWVAELEHYVPEIRQRADILVSKNGRSFAIEYQCSVIPISQLQERSRGYYSQGMTPMWILGGFPYQRILSERERLYRITDFQMSFAFFQMNSGFCLLSYHPFNKRMYQLIHIHPLTATKVFAYLACQPLETVLPSMPFLLNLTNHVQYEVFDLPQWFKEKSNWLQTKIYYASSGKDPFLFEVYKNGLHPLLLNPVIGMPVERMGVCKSHPIEWQFYLWIDALIKIPAGKTFSLAFILNLFHRRVSSKHLILRELPFISRNHITEMIRQYLDLLVQLDYLKREERGIYKMMKTISLAKNIMEAEELRNQLLKALRREER
ncbi:competence protein CoiA [Heyndrickxia acidicola]|uniref:Competence protein CoiA family protein n=1 Tax=Heyndrickxia acidicola TaxID=209389 RepID=A0ABU6MCY2_9BACI|nr:competence protein CoiA family protein [Heyndrickxia acidicola]MED1202523.1 competence protein CoiA family protein [Heyndrickxia acidicola]